MALIPWSAGYRFKGAAAVLESGARYEEVTAFFASRGVSNRIREVVVIKVEHALPVTSPAYDVGLSEMEIRTRWERHYEAIKRGSQEVAGE
jgi:hypothetical protein